MSVYNTARLCRRVMALIFFPSLSRSYLSPSLLSRSGGRRRRWRRRAIYTASQVYLSRRVSARARARGSISARGVITGGGGDLSTAPTCLTHSRIWAYIVIFSLSFPHLSVVYVCVCVRFLRFAGAESSRRGVSFVERVYSIRYSRGDTLLARLICWALLLASAELSCALIKFFSFFASGCFAFRLRYMKIALGTAVSGVFSGIVSLFSILCSFSIFVKCIYEKYITNNCGNS